jgi:predicted sugar kinase
MSSPLLTKDALKLKAIVEFGADYNYSIRQGTLGPTLYIETEDKALAAAIRKKAPLEWEGLRTMVLYTGPRNAQLFREKELDVPS